MKWTEFNMRTACAAVKAGLPIRKAAQRYAIPYTTLQGRLAGHLPHAVAHQDYQRLSIPQEDLLAEWILFQNDLGDPPSHVTIRELATRISIKRGDSYYIRKR